MTASIAHTSTNRSPEERLKEGHVADALLGLTARVRDNPADATQRVFLFQLLSLLGQWDRAQNQLDVAGELDPKNALLVGAYTAAIRGEHERAAVWAGLRRPTMIGEPAPWQAALLQANDWLGQERIALAASLRDQAFGQADAIGGRIDGVPFQWLADADPRFGPCLEIILKTGYAWVPFSHLRQLKFEAPADLRDTIWAPVEITWSNGGDAVGFIPCRYPGTEYAESSDIVLARYTDWKDLGYDYFIGRGQRMFATDAGEYSLLDVRSIEFGE